MALIGTIAINMRVQTQALGKGLKEASSMVHAFEASVVQTGASLKALVTGAAAYGAAKGIGKLITAGSDLAENMNKVQAIFGDNSAKIVKDAEMMATAFGVSKNEFLDAAGRMGGLFKGAGFASGEAANLSSAMVKLAADSSSFFNTDFETAFNKIRSGLSGESEPLRDFGVFLSEDGVKAQAYAMGLAKAGEELTNQQKVQARLAIITSSLSTAQGDLAKTADGVANASRSITGEIANLASAMGTALQPVAQAVLGEMNVAIQAGTLAWEASSTTVANVSSSVVDGAQAQTTSIGYIQTAIGWIVDAWQSVKIVFMFVQMKITEGLIFMVQGLEGFASGIGTIISYFTGAKFAGEDFAKTWLEDLQRMQKAQEETFNAELLKPKASENLGAAFDAARAKITAARAALAEAPKPGGGPLATGPAAKAKKEAKTQEVKFASAMLAGSGEAASTILRSRFGGGKAGDEAKKTAKNTENTAKNTGEIAAAMKKAPVLAVMETL